MATYNLSASDLITLLNSTVTTPTGKAILNSVSSAFGSAFPFGNTEVQTTNGPADTYPGGYAVTYNDTIGLDSTTGKAIQLDVITVPGSESSGAYTPGQAGTAAQTMLTAVSLTTGGGVIIAAGDQYTSVLDTNKGTVSDTLIGGVYQEKLFSVLGNNMLVAGSGASAFNTLQGGSGFDTLIGGGNSVLNSGTGANLLMSSTLTSGNDTLRGGIGADTLMAQAGNNILNAGSGHNLLIAGSGFDTLRGGGLSSLEGSSGATVFKESINGSHDTILGGTGSDTVRISLGLTGVAESIVGSTGALRVVDESGSNTIIGGSGAGTVLLANFFGQNSTVSNTANQTITAGTGGMRIVTAESAANYSVTQSGGTYDVKFSDSGQQLTINDTTGSSVTIVFGDGSTPVHI